MLCVRSLAVSSFRSALALGRGQTDDLGQTGSSPATATPEEQAQLVEELRYAELMLRRQTRRALAAASAARRKKDPAADTGKAPIPIRRAIVVDDMNAIDGAMFDDEEDTAAIENRVDVVASKLVELGIDDNAAGKNGAAQSSVNPPEATAERAGVGEPHPSLPITSSGVSRNSDSLGKHAAAQAPFRPAVEATPFFRRSPPKAKKVKLTFSFQTTSVAGTKPSSAAKAEVDSAGTTPAMSEINHRPTKPVGETSAKSTRQLWGALS